MSRRYAALIALSLAVSGCGISSGDEAPPSTSATYTAGQEVTFRVPTMHCPKGCFAIVRETLEQQPGVQSVKLYPQPAEDEITDRRVLVALKGPFDADRAIAVLATEGFEGATVASP